MERQYKIVADGSDEALEYIKKTGSGMQKLKMLGMECMKAGGCLYIVREGIDFGIEIHIPSFVKYLRSDFMEQILYKMANIDDIVLTGCAGVEAMIMCSEYDGVHIYKPSVFVNSIGSVAGMQIILDTLENSWCRLVRYVSISITESNASFRSSAKLIRLMGEYTGTVKAEGSITKNIMREFDVHGRDIVARSDMAELEAESVQACIIESFGSRPDNSKYLRIKDRLDGVVTDALRIIKESEKVKDAEFNSSNGMAAFIVEETVTQLKDCASSPFGKEKLEKKRYSLPDFREGIVYCLGSAEIELITGMEDIKSAVLSCTVYAAEDIVFFALLKCREGIGLTADTFVKILDSGVENLLQYKTLNTLKKALS